jgi:adenine-specific DNA methylase
MQTSQLLSDNSALTVRYFGGLYFSYAQAVDIDLLLYETFLEDAAYRDIYLASILSTASDLVNTVGKQFAQPIRPRNADGTPKKNLGKILAKDRTLDTFRVFKGWLECYISLERYGNNHTVYKKDYSEALDLLGSDTKIIYADPPYTRDHYSRFYHVLETLCLRDNPTISTSSIGGVTKLSRGVYREDRHQSPFCIKSKAPEAFETLFSKSRNLNAILLLSYSPYDEKSAHPRLLTIKDLRKTANKYYKHIDIVTPGNFSHSKLNSSDKRLDSSKKAELLMICSVD